MNEVIDLNEMPAMFGMCNVKECPQAETCQRQIVYHSFVNVTII